MKRRILKPGLVAIVLLPLAAAAAEKRPDGTQTVIEVSYRAGALTLDARGAPLADVLRAIGEKAGFRTHLTGDLSKPVDLSLENAPLVPTVLRLVGRHSMVMIMHPNADKRRAGAISEINVRAKPLRTENRPARRFLTSIQEELDLGPPAQRITTIDELEKSGDSKAVAMLEKFAGHDKEEAVRGHAIGALGRVAGQPAILSLGRILFGSSNPESRRLAAKSLASRRSNAARLFLKEATNDTDDDVRREALNALAK